MQWYQWLTFLALAWCLINLLIIIIRLILLGPPKDYSKKRGDIKNAVRYSLTGAMSPLKKESAYLNLPTYTAGLLYHFGTFLSIFIFFLIIFNIPVTGDLLRYILAAFLVITGLCGTGILIKRLIKKNLRALSNPDDYISNILVTVFQFITAALMITGSILPSYYILSSVLLFYLPVGKLKHTVYFFAARYHLGFFYGWRGVWPPKQKM
ncbi:MAG: hypothetical protein K8R53_13785 [Bacteroidales bacterium]|nr:hypothetical protein [Bacteroidales bacterium]